VFASGFYPLRLRDSARTCIRIADRGSERLRIESLLKLRFTGSALLSQTDSMFRHPQSIEHPIAPFPRLDPCARSLQLQCAHDFSVEDSLKHSPEESEEILDT